MWYLRRIPKVCHFYYGGDKMFFIRYLSIKTFIKYNPDWQVVFWHPRHPFKGRSWGTEFNPKSVNNYKDYLPEVYKLPIINSEVDFSELGFNNDMPEVHKNDYIRIHSLYLYGGVWSDTDIIYFHSIDDLEVNSEKNKDKHVFVCISDYGHSTGFNMASEGNEFFGSLKSRINREYKRNGYQCLGPDLFNKYYKTIDLIPDGVNMDMESVYAHDCYNVKELLTNYPPRFNGHSIGCHWYGGNTMWTKFMNDTRGGEVNLPDTIIGNLIKDAILVL